MLLLEAPNNWDKLLFLVDCVAKMKSFCLIKSMQEHAAWSISRVMMGRQWIWLIAICFVMAGAPHRVSFVSSVYHVHRGPFGSAERFAESQRSRQAL